MVEPRIKKQTGQTGMNKCSGGECRDGDKCCGDCTPENIISVGSLLEGLEKDPCKGCDGDPCPHLVPDGYTCMGIEGLKVIPGATEHYCKDCDGNFCLAQGLSCSGEE